LSGKDQAEKQGALRDTPSGTGSLPASDESDQLERLAHDLDLLSSRADSVNGSLITLRETQRAQGLGLRGDVASAQERMQRYMAGAQSALRNQDARNAKKYLDLAETEVSTLEKFLGR
jgi:eukaryotic-like serine/threonine-protein kinase